MIRATHRPSHVRTFAVVVGLVALIGGLHAASRLGLRGPADLNVEGINAWMEDPVEVMATVARWISLVLAYYLLVIVGATSFFGERLEETSWGRVTPAAVVGLAGILLGTTAVALPAVAHARSSSAAPTLPEALVLEEVQTPLTLVEVLSETEAQLQSDATVPPEGLIQGDNADSLWTVQSGDSFWSIAEETLSEDLARTDLTDAEIVDYWRLLIEANEDDLVDPGNPDLILPGQVLVLPPT